MGNINPIGKGPQSHSSQDKPRKEIKGLASSEETRASSVAASESEQSSMLSRASLIEKFGKEVGDDIADALDKLKQEGKFLSFEAVKALIKGAFERHQKDFSKYEKETENVCNLVSHEFVVSRRKEEGQDFAASVAAKIGELQKKERESKERMEEKITEDDSKRAQEKREAERKRMIDPKKRV